MQSLVNTCMTTLSEGSDAFDDFVSPFCDPCQCLVYTASHLTCGELRGRNYETDHDITMLTARHRGYFLNI